MSVIEAAVQNAECACCGNPFGESQLVRLGCQAEVGLCFECARWLYLQSKERADALHPSWAGRLRDMAREPRRIVLRHGWQDSPTVGRLLRRLGRYVP